MRKLIMVAIATIVGHFAVNEYNRVKTDLVISEASADILRDGLEDLANEVAELRSGKSYDDGVKDGISNAKNSDWVAGYHFAASQFGSEATTLTSEVK